MENNLLREEDKKYIFRLFIFSVFVHGFMLFNKFALNDDNDSMFSLKLTFDQGRWLDGYINKACQFLGRSCFLSQRLMGC